MGIFKLRVSKWIYGFKYNKEMIKSGYTSFQKGEKLRNLIMIHSN